jgi:hypothetical protein
MRSAVARVCIAACVIHAPPAWAQSITTEASIAAGHSTEEQTSAGATQLRAFGDLTSGIRFYAEAAWGATTDEEIDAFGTAYPYGNRVQLIEAYAERLFRPGSSLFGLKAGRYRTPFGISSSSDQGYTGFLRPPLMRYDGYFSISNNFLEQGIDVIAGVPRFTVEGTLGTPADVGQAERPSGLDAVVRVQGYAGPVIAGASYIRTLPYQSPSFAFGRAEFTGVDLRVTHAGIQLRGEFIDGRPFNGTKTIGGYADLLVHHVGMGPVTAVARIEDLSYETAPPFDLHGSRQTVGANIRILDALALHVNVIHQAGAPATYGAKAIDLGLTYSIRR